jgi:hypothetical protein
MDIWNHTQPAKVVLREKFIAMSEYIKKKNQRQWDVVVHACGPKSWLDVREFEASWATKTKQNKKEI